MGKRPWYPPRLRQITNQEIERRPELKRAIAEMQEHVRDPDSRRNEAAGSSESEQASYDTARRKVTRRN